MNKFVADLGVDQEVEEGQVPDYDQQPKDASNNLISTKHQNIIDNLHSPPSPRRSQSSEEIIFQTVTDKAFKQVEQDARNKDKKRPKIQNKPTVSTPKRQNKQYEKDKKPDKRQPHQEQDNEPTPNQFAPNSHQQKVSMQYPVNTPPPFYSPYMYPPVNLSMPQMNQMPMSNMYGYSMPPNYMHSQYPPYPQYQMPVNQMHMNPSMNMPMPQNHGYPPGMNMASLPSNVNNNQYNSQNKYPNYNQKDTQVNQDYYKNQKGTPYFQNSQKFQEKPYFDRNNDKSFSNPNKQINKQQETLKQKKRLAIEDIKTQARKGMKIFTNEEQAEILQSVKCLIKYSKSRGVSNPSQNKGKDIGENIYQNCLNRLLSMISQGDEKREALYKLLSSLQLKVTLMDLKERKMLRRFQDGRYLKSSKEGNPADTEKG